MLQKARSTLKIETEVCSWGQFSLKFFKFWIIKTFSEAFYKYLVSKLLKFIWTKMLEKAWRRLKLVKKNL